MEYIHKIVGNKIINACSTFREDKNVVQQISTYYEYFSNNLAKREITTKYWDFKKTLSELLEFLKGNNHIVCINDSGLIGDTSYIQKRLKISFNQIVPDKSEKYEI